MVFINTRHVQLICSVIIQYPPPCYTSRRTPNNSPTRIPSPTTAEFNAERILTKAPLGYRTCSPFPSFIKRGSARKILSHRNSKIQNLRYCSCQSTLSTRHFNDVDSSHGNSQNFGCHCLMFLHTRYIFRPSFSSGSKDCENKSLFYETALKIN